MIEFACQGAGMDYRTLQVTTNGDGDNIKAREEI
jgi:hypothetical protein